MENPPAPLYLRRSLAFGCDALVGMSPLWLVSPLLLFLAASNDAENVLVAESSLLLALPACIVFYYLVSLVQSLRHRPTVGQKLFGLRRVSRDKEQPPARPALVRVIVVGALPSAGLVMIGLWPLLLLLPASALVFTSGQAIGDALAGTVVVSSDGD